MYENDTRIESMVKNLRRIKIHLKDELDNSEMQFHERNIIDLNTSEDDRASPDRSEEMIQVKEKREVRPRAARSSDIVHQMEELANA